MRNIKQIYNKNPEVKKWVHFMDGEDDWDFKEIKDLSHGNLRWIWRKRNDRKIEIQIRGNAKRNGVKLVISGKKHLEHSISDSKSGFMIDVKEKLYEF